MEAYLARSLGFTLVPFAVMFLFLTGAIPLGSDATSSKSIKSYCDVFRLIQAVDISDVRASPYTTPTLLLTTLYHSFVGFYTYSRYVNKATSQFSYLLATMLSGMLAAMGLWVLMFGGESHISRRTGADKRTGNWPFGNKEAAKSRVPKSVTRAQLRMQQQQGMRGEDIELKEL